MKNKFTVAVFLLLITSAALMTPSDALAQNEKNVNINTILPSASGYVGASASVTGTISTFNGPYQVIIGKNIVASGNSNGYNVNANFTVPELSAATYAFVLRDLNLNINATKQFTISTGYSIKISPSAVQEGKNVTVDVAVTGGQLGTPYGAEVAISTPDGELYIATVDLGIPNGKGTASKQLAFPGDSFTPSGAVTDYAGTYKITFNQTLAVASFNADILDSSEYHRGQTVTIHATGYQPNQAATITISVAATGDTISSFGVTASASGVINTNWVVAAGTPIGECIVKIVPEGTQKAAKDQQTFTVVGYAVKVVVTNLSGRAVRGINVRVIDDATKLQDNATSDINGLAQFMLEKGPHSIAAFWNDVNVAQSNLTIAGDGNFTLRCQLTDMKITVATVDVIAMSFVNLAIKYNYQAGSITRSGNIYGQTDPSGSYVLASTLAGATYIIDASVYNRVFNTGNNTVSNLPNQATSEVTIICPTKNLTMGITGYSNQPIPNAHIEFVEISNGLFYSAKTDGAGTAIAQPTFGTYRVRIYQENALIKETNMQIFENRQEQIHCTLYGIQLVVSVVDLFGSPIPNANVTLNGPSKVSAATQSNGLATFDDIVGGKMQILAQVQGVQDASQVLVTEVNEPATVQVKMDKYISAGGLLMQASTFITIIVVVVLSVLFLAVEMFWRRKNKPTASVTK